MDAPRSSTTRFARRGNARLAYEVASAAGDAAPVAVLLHPLLADHGALAPLRDALAPGYRLLLPDARGHGASAGLADRRTTLDDAAADALAVLDAAGYSHAHLIGQGLGGATAFALARIAPARVRSLTLIEPTLPAILDSDGRPAAHAARTAAQTVSRAAADAAYKGQTDQALHRLLDDRLGRDWPERLPRPRLATIRRHAQALAGTLTALDGYGLDQAAAARVTCPALIVHAPAAPPLDRLVCERLAAAMPHARLAVLPVHDPFGLGPDDPTAVIAAVAAFLSEADNG